MQCIVPGCDDTSASTDEGVTFHIFPTEPILRETWLRSLGLQGWESDKKTVSSKHFQKEDLVECIDGQYSVRAGAAPVNLQNSSKRENWMKSNEVKICRICFTAAGNLYPMAKYKNLDQSYKILTGIPKDNDNLPAYLCMECSHRLQNCIQFKNRSIKANLILQRIVKKYEYLTLDAIRSCSEYLLLRSSLITHKQTNHYDLDIVHVERKNVYAGKRRNIVNTPKLCTVNVVKVEKDQMLSQKSLGQDRIYNTVSPPRLHEVTVPGIKLERDDAYNHDSLNHEAIINYKENLSSFHDTMGIKVKVEKIEMTNQDSVDDVHNSHDHIPVDVMSAGEEYSSDNPLIAEQQKGKPRPLSYITAHTRTSSNINTHSGKKQYYCDVCKKEFNQKYSLINHLRKHSGEKPHECNICKKTFIFKNVLESHMSTHVGEKPYSCNQCDKVFNQRANLKAHINIHSGEKPFSCDVCDQVFSQRCNLISHARTHSGDKPYSCNMCKISFSRNYYLKIHMKRHSDEKPYSCDVCKKTFNLQSYLHKHMNIHSGVKPYSCNVCDKAFNRKGNLNTHIKTHTDEKPYLCLICSKAFRRKDQLKTHFNVHSGEKPLGVNIQDLSDNI